jgi:hypothetical protein
MRPFQRCILLAASTVVVGATPNVAQQLCQPAVTVADAHISEARNMQRTWSAALTVDASRCSATSGQFEVEFTRLKENAPDMQFIERFTWVPGRTRISLDMWWDEWLQDYRIGRIAPCPCRN